MANKFEKAAVPNTVLFDYTKSRDSKLIGRFNRRHFNYDYSTGTWAPKKDSKLSELLTNFISIKDELSPMLTKSNLGEAKYLELRAKYGKYIEALNDLYYEVDKIRFGEEIADELQDLL